MLEKWCSSKNQEQVSEICFTNLTFTTFTTFFAVTDPNSFTWRIILEVVKVVKVR